MIIFWLTCLVGYPRTSAPEPKPSLQVRTKIWQSMLPDVDEATLSSIASQYDFSGGQIENIARKALVDDLLFYSSDICNKERIYTFFIHDVL